MRTGQDQTPPGTLPVELDDTEADEVTPPPSERDWDRTWQPPFLRSLATNDNVSRACRIVGIARSTAYDARDRDERFREAWDESVVLSADVFDENLHRWSTIGVPVRKVVTTTTTDRQGNVTETRVVETESAERSAQIAIFYARARWPEKYRPERHEHTGADGGPIQLAAVDQLDAQLVQATAELEAAAAAPA